MTEEIKFPRPVTEYDRIFVSRHGRGYCVFGRRYTTLLGEPLPYGRTSQACNIYDEVLYTDINLNRADLMCIRIMQIKELAHAMRGES